MERTRRSLRAWADGLVRVGRRICAYVIDELLLVHALLLPRCPAGPNIIAEALTVNA
jgi:hypothetical protein